MYTAGAKVDLSNIFRFFPVDNYLVFYCADDEARTVFVVRIMYGGQDISAQLAKIDDATKN